ncbi:MAG: hypothetical protein KDE52_10685 [Calditrichaeota bacterium]|nr:hypothetical protein [Calditrichota bacterium]
MSGKLPQGYASASLSDQKNLCQLVIPAQAGIIGLNDRINPISSQKKARQKAPG